ncbi:MAG: hypothetical protein U0Q16_06740 [Bryobacteraceae bacterium]
MATMSADPLGITVMLEELRRRDADMRSVPEEMAKPMRQIGALLDKAATLMAMAREAGLPTTRPMPKAVERLVMNLQTHDIFSQRLAHIYPVFSIIWKTVDCDGRPARPIGPPNPKVLPLLCQATSLASSLLCATRMELDRSILQIRDALRELAAVLEGQGGAPINIESPMIALDLLETRIRSAEFVLDQLHQALRVVVPSEVDQDFFIELPEGQFDDLLRNYSMSAEHQIHRAELGSSVPPEKAADPGDVVLF